MDNPNWWINEMSAISGAPALFALAVGIAAVLIWRGVNWAYSRQIEGLRDQIGSLARRLELAADEFRIATEKKDRVERAMAELQKQLNAEKSLPSVVAGTSASVAENLVILDNAWANLGTTIATRSLVPDLLRKGGTDLPPPPKTVLDPKPKKTR